MPVSPPKWGPSRGIDSKDYILYMQGPAGPTDRPQSLLGHSLTSPNQNLTDPLTFTEVRLKNGRVVPVTVVKRAAVETSRTYTIGYPIGAIWSPALERAIRQGCNTTFYLIYTCPEDDIYSHWIILPDGVLNPPIEAEDVITTNEDTNMIAETSELQVSGKIRGYKLGWERMYDFSGTIKTHGLAFVSENCPDCDYTPGLAILTAGGDATAAPDIKITEDRFQNLVAVTGNATAGDSGKDIYNDGDTIIIAYFTGATYTAATAGKLYISKDRGATAAVQISGLVSVISRIFRAGSTLFAIGKNASGDAVIHTSDDNGSSWSAVTSTVLPTGSALLDGGYDEGAQRVIFVGEDAKVLIGRMVGSTLTLTDISANLPSPGGADLNAVAVLGKNNYIIGGAGGYCVETRNGGVSFKTVAAAGSTAITAIAGNQNQTVIGAGTSIYVRNVMTNNDFVKQVFQFGQTLAGNVSRLIMGLDDNFNLFAGSTLSGEIFIGKPFYPNS